MTPRAARPDSSFRPDRPEGTTGAPPHLLLTVLARVRLEGFFRLVPPPTQDREGGPPLLPQGCAGARSAVRGRMRTGAPAQQTSARHRARRSRPRSTRLRTGSYPQCSLSPQPWNLSPAGTAPFVHPAPPAAGRSRRVRAPGPAHWLKRARPSSLERLRAAEPRVKSLGGTLPALTSAPRWSPRLPRSFEAPAPLPPYRPAGGAPRSPLRALGGANEHSKIERSRPEVVGKGLGRRWRGLARGSGGRAGNEGRLSTRWILELEDEERGRLEDARMRPAAPRLPLSAVWDPPAPWEGARLAQRIRPQSSGLSKTLRWELHILKVLLKYVLWFSLHKYSWFLEISLIQFAFFFRLWPLQYLAIFKP